MESKMFSYPQEALLLFVYFQSSTSQLMDDHKLSLMIVKLRREGEKAGRRERRKVERERGKKK